MLGASSSRPMWNMCITQGVCTRPPRDRARPIKTRRQPRSTRSTNTTNKAPKNMTTTANQVMKAEHRNIETVVKALGDLAFVIEKGQRADVAMLATALKFLRVYADKLHHVKEETLFFPMLVKRGVPP